MNDSALDHETAALKPVGRVRIAARILGGLALAFLVPALVLFAVANGPTPFVLAFTGGVIGIGLIAMLRLPAAGPSRVAVLATTAVCGIAVLTFIVVRLSVAPPPQSFRFVEEGHRDASPPWLSRLVDERETVLAGLHFANTVGIVGGPEMDHLHVLLHGAYPASWRPWPNAVLIDSSPAAPRHLEHVPAGSTRLPCIVFLHGFGGQLTAYLRVLDEALGDRFVIIAPFLDYTGAFWTPRGRQTVHTLVTRYLPAEADPDHVFLIGLSNGAAAATAILQDPELSRLFQGFVLVSGIGEAVQPMVRANVLLIAGTEDARFPLHHVQGMAEALRDRGALIEIVTFPADHFLWLSHAHEMTMAIDRWLSVSLR